MKSKINEHTKNNNQSVSNNLKNYYSCKIFLFATAIISLIACERELSDDATLSSNNKNPDVFIDTFSAGLGYGAFGGSKYTAFTVDQEVKYEGTSSMRFDVPSDGDVNGSYAGGVFIDGSGRDLTSYDALTFYVKGSKAATLNEVGFGTDFGLNKYKVTISKVNIGTNWQKITIPMPDASKLTQEKGMFWYSEGPENGLGYSFWIDNLKYEKLGTISKGKSSIFNGVDEIEQTFIGAKISLSDLFVTFNMANGLNQKVYISPSYFKFTSDNPAVATVSELGLVEVKAGGTCSIKATLAGLETIGSLTINSLGVFIPAPKPPQDAANVISIFSNAYTNVPVEYYNGYYKPFQTTQGQADIKINGDDIIKYSQFNFVGIQFAQPTINASQMTHFHLDLKVQNTTGARNSIKFKLVDFGSDGVFEGGNDSELLYTYTNPALSSNTWIGVDVPIASFTGTSNRLNLAQIILENNSGITDILVDNIYFYNIPTAPIVAAPTPTLPSANVISLFSNAYTNIAVDTWRTSWSQAAFADVLIVGNATKEYSNLNFVGIETVNNQINATNMNFVHIDVWSENFTAFSIKLVDFGANATFAGGDDTEHQVNYTTPLKNQWISYDIPLSSFTGLLNRQHLAQYILVGKPQGTSKIYIDNFYFHN